MNQTGYTGIQQGIRKSKNTLGGFCSWYFTPVENIEQWPSISPITQKARSKPILKDGTFWYRSDVNRQVSFDETPKQNAAGNYYDWKFNVQAAGYFPILMQNLPYRRFIILAAPRALPHTWLLIGTQVSPLKFESGFDSGRHWVETALTKILFLGECRHRALIVPFTQEEIDNGPIISPSLLATEEGFALVTEDQIEITI